MPVETTQPSIARSADRGLMERTPELARTKTLLHHYCRRTVAAIQTDTVNQIGPTASPRRTTSPHFTSLTRANSPGRAAGNRRG